MTAKGGTAGVKGVLPTTRQRGIIPTGRISTDVQRRLECRSILGKACRDAKREGETPVNATRVCGPTYLPGFRRAGQGR